MDVQITTKTVNLRDLEPNAYTYNWLCANWCSLSEFNENYEQKIRVVDTFTATSEVVNTYTNGNYCDMVFVTTGDVACISTTPSFNRSTITVVDDMPLKDIYLDISFESPDGTIATSAMYCTFKWRSREDDSEVRFLEGGQLINAPVPYMRVYNDIISNDVVLIPLSIFSPTNNGVRYIFAHNTSTGIFYHENAAYFYEPYSNQSLALMPVTEHTATLNTSPYGVAEGWWTDQHRYTYEPEDVLLRERVYVPDRWGNTISSYGLTDEAIKRIVACTGMYFKYDGEMYLGYMDESGQTTGEYLTADEWEKSAQYDKDTIKNFTEHKDPISPEPEPEPDDDDYPSLSLDTIGATGLANGVSWFVMDDDDMLRLSKLGVYYTEEFETPWMTIAKANAVAETSKDAIISILQFPYDIARMHSAEGRHGLIHVYIPGVFNSDSEWFGADYCATGASGGYITDLNRIINAGSVLIPPRANKATFLDFEPYTSLQMYVPFAGWVSLPCSQCMGATVALQYVIDPPTGSGRAYISANGCIIKDIPFTIGTVTPTTVHQTGPLMSTLMNTAFSVAGTVAGAALAAESGGLSMAVGSSMAVGAVSNLSNTLMDSCVPKTQTIGTNGTAVTSFPSPKTPVIIINRPRVKIPDNMGHRYGYACDKEATLSSLTGMTVCSNVDTAGFNATAGEKARLKAILESGFYA